MRPELPGFYYDPEKNRYFPIKGRIPGSASSSRTTTKPNPKPIQKTYLRKKTNRSASKLLCLRELNGNVLPLINGKFNFKEEFQQMQASHPMVWKYRGTKKIGDAAMEYIQIDAQTPEGQTRKDILVMGNTIGSLRLLQVTKVGQLSEFGIQSVPVRVFPRTENDTEHRRAPWLRWRRLGVSEPGLSSISSIKLLRKHDAQENMSNVNYALITTLGSEGLGSVFLFNPVEALDFTQGSPIVRQSIHRVTSFDCTIWTADCNFNGSHAAIGTNLGGAMVDLETGASSWFLRSKSDVLALQFDQLGNVIRCGLRNGAIVTVDVRERPQTLPRRFTRHRIPYQSSSKTAGTSNRQWFELKGNLNPSHMIYMPSSISCLATLKIYNQYFMASSMDGSIKLYDQRMIKRDCVQSYEGHVNSHTRIQLGVDPSERFVLSGGEDCAVRVWSIKSGQLLCENRFANYVPSVVCWPGPERTHGDPSLLGSSGKSSWEDSNVPGAWLGSHEGIFYFEARR